MSHCDALVHQGKNAQAVEDTLGTQLFVERAGGPVGSRDWTVHWDQQARHPGHSSIISDRDIHSLQYFRTDPDVLGFTSFRYDAFCVGVRQRSSGFLILPKPPTLVAQRASHTSQDWAQKFMMLATISFSFIKQGRGPPKQPARQIGNAPLVKLFFNAEER